MLIILYTILGALLIGISEVLRYHIEPMTISARLRKKINTAWHIYRDLGILSYMIMSWQLPKELLSIVMWIPLLWAIHWILTDGIQNVLKGKDWFYTSPTSGNYVEMLGKWYVKIGLLLAGITFKVYVKNINNKHRK